MAAHHELGRRGEELARRFLEKQGYVIEAENWRFSRAEIDLVAREGDSLVFVEVKTRSRYSPRFGRPEEAVSSRKEEQLADAAAAYMRDHHHEWSFRFDIISVLIFSTGHFQIRHYPDAFFPGL